ncbi:MAG: bifunctional UDP-N-acetylglucosamine diphosphorylase/glucosamine-1-phosphate N-acetyltransferase GlmU [Elusimicrobiota bacterium]
MKKSSFLILAAGKGTRMKSELPKVLHSVGGLSMLERVCNTAQELKPSSLSIIIGHQGERVKNKISPKFKNVTFYTQPVLDGSGGAVRRALSWIKRQKGVIFVACGDAPLITAQTFKLLLQTHHSQKNAVTVLTTIHPQPFGYGRIVRSYDNSVEKIVEHLDASHEERQISEINSGTYCFEAAWLAKALPKLSNKNAKKEFYLTDTLEIIRKWGGRVGAAICPNYMEVMGVNSRVELAMIEKALYLRKVETLMVDGVSIIDPNSTYIDDDVQIGSDTIIYPQTFISGKTKIGSHCQIGPFVQIKDCLVENNVIFKASFADSALIRGGAKVGPFSHIRPKSDVGVNAHIGNFSELKNTQLGEGSKVNHLSYLGDTKCGKNVNIGAGTITCNYDGFKKFPTLIQDHAFIGSNVNLIAPIQVGAHSVVGAGSSISEDVPSWSLAVERSRAIVKKDWAKARLKKGKKS